ncbi:MAG: lipocalin family protein [Bacteriovoracaceae bacterium]|nr:lipocalin family protein [Bacteriovoracaceae bacterium]
MKKLLLIVMFVSCSSLSAKYKPLPTVDHVDVDRYLGNWYEIARFDQRFQKGCTATEANYSFRDDGTIRVLNRCRIGSPNGELKEAVGRAWIKDKKSNAKLKVQFFLRNFRFFLFAGNYWILDLDEEYQHVLIGEPKRKYLWILSRTKDMDPATYKRLVNKAKKLGFDTKKLLKTIH